MPLYKSAAANLVNLVTADGLTGGFVKDSEVSTFARTFLDETSAPAIAQTLGLWRTVAKSGVVSSHTGSTDETVLATVPISAGLIGPNGMLWIRCLFSFTNNGNVKAPAIYLNASGGGIGGSKIYGSSGYASIDLASIERVIWNRNNAAAQIVSFPVSSAQNWNTIAAPAPTFTQNTAVATDVVFTGDLANGADTISLEAYEVRVLYGA